MTKNNNYVWISKFYTIFVFIILIIGLSLLAKIIGTVIKAGKRMTGTDRTSAYENHRTTPIPTPDTQKRPRPGTTAGNHPKVHGRRFSMTMKGNTSNSKKLKTNQVLSQFQRKIFKTQELKIQNPYRFS